MFPFLEPVSKYVFQIYSIGKDLKNKEFNLEDVRSLIKKIVRHSAKLCVSKAQWKKKLPQSISIKLVERENSCSIV